MKSIADSIKKHLIGDLKAKGYKSMFSFYIPVLRNIKLGILVTIKLGRVVQTEVFYSFDANDPKIKSLQENLHETKQGDACVVPVRIAQA
jgi:hypothetical protein